MPYMFKIINSGDGGVGKTSFLKRFTSGVYFEQSKSTIGTGFFTKSVKLNNNDHADLTIWDFGGQGRFRDILRDFMIGAHGALLLFDITRYQSFSNLKEWITLLRSKEDNYEIPVLLLGTKCDLADVREVFPEDIQKFVDEKHLIGYYETSAKSGINIENSIKQLVQYIFDHNKGFTKLRNMN
jgi:Ras-related protein Rab-11A